MYNHGSQATTKARLVFAIQFHKYLDVILAPYMVHEHATGEFSLAHKRLNALTLDDHFVNYSAFEKQAVEILDACRDGELMRKFLKNATTPRAFFNELPECRLKRLVVPWVQKQTDRCLRILRENGVPLYYKGNRKDHLDSHPVYIQEGEATAIFNFARQGEETCYRLTLMHKGKEISLASSGSMVLTSDPCWIYAQGKIWLLENGIDGAKVKPFFTRDHISIPRHAWQKYFSTFMANVIRRYEVRTEGIEIEVEELPFTPHLKLESDLRGRPVISLSFRYNNRKCTFGDPNDCWVEFTGSDDCIRFKKILRDRKREEFFARGLTGEGLHTTDNHLYYPEQHYQEDEAAADKTALWSLVIWLSENTGKLQGAGYEIEQGYFRENFFTGKAGLDFSMEEGNDWFDIHAFAVFGTFRIPFINLRGHLLSGNREYVLPDGMVAILPEEWFSRYNDLFIYGKSADEGVKLKKHHFMIAGKSLPGGGRSGIFDLADKSKLAIPVVPPGMDDILRPYQKAGFSWMYFLYRHKLGGCLADDMGLGKTLQTLTLLWKIKLEKPCCPDPPATTGSPKTPVQLDLFSGRRKVAGSAVNTSLIVMPLSLMYNWENEIRKFTPGLKCIKYSGMNREQLADCLPFYDIVLTTYGVVRNDLGFLKKHDFFYLILDESQVIKNPNSKIFRAVRQLRARHRLVLTGTPVENSLGDLWSQLSFLNPGLLGSQRFFREEFIYPIEKQQNQEKKDRLRNMIEPFILRRKKKQVEKDLPDLTEEVYYCEMSEDQEKLYEQVKSEIRNSIFRKLEEGNEREVRIDALRGLTRLRLIASHPLLAGHRDAESGKFTEVVRNIENLMAEGHKLLIFSQFVKHLGVYRDYFNEQGWNHSWLTGEINERMRKEVVSRFQDDPSNLLFLISLKAGGVGLNLTAADYVFILDPWWNPAVEHQAVSRAHRIGRKRNVMSYRFISAGSVEEKILSLQQRKSDIASGIIETGNPLKYFTLGEIAGLFE